VLDAMRKNAADSVTLKVVFSVIVIVFVFWGIGGLRNNPMQVVARVNGKVITAREFERAYANMSRAYQQVYPQGAPEDMLRGQVLDQLVTNELLTQEADHLGLAVGNDELRQSIIAIPSFQVDGQFSKDAYLRTLQLNNLKPSDFESLQTQQLLVNKVQELIRAGVHITDEQVLERYRYENGRVELRFVRIPANDFVKQVNVSDADAQAYYDKHKEDFREPERMRIRFIDFRPEHFAADVKPTDEDIQAYYDAHTNQFEQPEEVRARHILIRLAPGASPADRDAAHKRAEEILQKAKAGADFAELAKQNSDDVTAADGGDLGFFARGKMTPAFEAAAFALSPGQISDVVETPFGFHIIKVEEKHEAHTATLDEVRDKVVEAVKKERGRELALDKSEEAHDRLLEGQHLEDVAAAYGLKVETPPPFGRHEPITGVAQNDALADVVFQTEPGQIGDIATLDTGYVVFRAEERIATFIPELSAVRDKVDAALKHEGAVVKAKEKAEELLKQLKEKPDLDAAAAADGFKVEETGPVARLGGYVPQIGAAQDLKDAAFALTKQSPVAPSVYQVEGNSFVVVLKDRLPADDSKLDAAQKKALRERMRQRAENAAVQQFVSELRTAAQVEIGQGFTKATGS
jgi:peptidyl-prolyl cis-trans isomerase D